MHNFDKGMFYIKNGGHFDLGHFETVNVKIQLGT